VAYSSTMRTKVYLGTTKPTVTAADYSTDTFTEVTGLTSLGDFGDEFEVVSFDTINDGRKHKVKGSADAGNWDFEIARDPGDAGQIALRAAAKSPEVFNVKVVLVDGTKFYFSGAITSAKMTFGDNTVNKQKFQVGITTEVFEVAA
jgi:hypothetical protein